MSTNYYFTTDMRNPLSLYGEIHIGKQSAGWVFSFQGYYLQGGITRVAVDRYSGVPAPVEIPSLVVKSAAMWEEILKYGTSKNEYSEIVSNEDFWNNRISKPKKDGKQRCHSKEYCENPKHNWVDAEGYSFSGYEFS